MMSTVFLRRQKTFCWTYGTPCLAQMALTSGAVFWYESIDRSGQRWSSTW